MRRTKSGLPKHCCWNLDRPDGVRRVRFRRNGFSTYLIGTPWSPEFMAAYAQALDGAKPVPQNIGAGRTAPGSFDALCIAYYRSPEFCGLKAITQTEYRQLIERLRADYGKLPIRSLERRHIKALMAAKAETPMAANNFLKVMRILLNCAVDLQLIASNPAAGIKRYRQKGDGFPTWTELEVAQFRAAHAIGTKPRLALELLLGTGQRRSDVVRLGWQHFEGDDLAFRQSKTDRPQRIRIDREHNPQLKAALASVPRGNLPFLLDDRGRPFEPRIFGTWFRRRCAEAGLKGRSAHGLRKTAATRIVNAGGSTEQGKAFTGHKSHEFDRYVRDADQAKLAREALLLVQAHLEQNETQNCPADQKCWTKREAS